MQRETFVHDLQFFRELISCGREVYSWIYNRNMEPVYSNCPNELSFHLLFSQDQQFESLLQYADICNRPMVLSNSFGLMWIADFEYDSAGQMTCVHVIGPVFYDDISPSVLEREFSRLNLSVKVKQQVTEVLAELPIIPTTSFLEYGLMLHYTLTGEKISRSEFLYPKEISAPTHSPASQVSNHHGTWAAEQAMLKLVEEGNLDYKKQRERLPASGVVGKMSNGDPIRQIKNQLIVFTALCTRAAIRGGLDPDTAYTVSDRYIQNIESRHTVGELAEVNRAMEEDFVRRVHKLKTQSGISPQIQKCCDYIQLHVEEKLPVTELAAHVGYTENYLTKKFRQEMGVTIGTYVLSAKMERAKSLLTNSNSKVQEIAVQLGFLSLSYFCEQFKRVTGATPREWRNGT